VSDGLVLAADTWAMPCLARTGMVAWETLE
jgi:hypothetical protein